MKLFLAALVCVLMLVSSTPASAQADEVYVHITEYKMPFDRMGRAMEIIRANIRPVSEEMQRAGHLLSEEWLAHRLGDEYTLVRISHFPNWETVDYNANRRAALRRLMPDEDEIRAAVASLQELFQGVEHRDRVYALIR